MVTMNLDELTRNALRYALANAVKYDGKARPEAVFGRLMAETQDRIYLEEVRKISEDAVKTVNALLPKEQIERLTELSPELLETKRKEKEVRELPPLPNAVRYKKIVMRLAPYPSGPLHIGNARMVILNDEYSRLYKGKLILAYDDTIGSVEKKIVPAAYDLIKDGLDWLGVKIDKVIYKSDRLPIFYEWARVLLERNLAYVCLCEAEILRSNRNKGVNCSCVDSGTNTNLDRWDKMLGGTYGEGEAVVRLRTGMKHPNPAFRDRVLLRIAERTHPRVGDKYRVWPMLEFSWAIDDHLLGITHILRGKDLVIEDMMESYLWDLLKWDKPEIIHHGLLQISGVKLSKTKSNIMIAKKVYGGWDDPQTWSLQSLKRRGIRPEALREFILSFGLSLSEVSVPLDNLYAINKKLLDAVSNRYFFVNEPINLTIEEMPSKIECEIPRHPDFPERGHRSYIVTADVNKKTTLLISKGDFISSKETEFIRLIDLCNLKIIKKEENRLNTIYHSAEYKESQKLNARLIHWLPEEGNVQTRVIMPDGTAKEGLVEAECANLNADTVVQFVRFGFVRIDNKTNGLTTFFAHN
jgi:glutamyl-tRNA synthetase